MFSYQQYLDGLCESPSNLTSEGKKFLSRRLQNEGIRAFVTGVSLSYDHQFRSMSETGHLDFGFDPWLSVGCLTPEGDPLCTLEILGAFSKLSLDFYAPKADFVSFLARSRECENYAGHSWAHMPTGPAYQRWIRRMLGLAPRVVRCKHGPGTTAERLKGVDKWIPIITPGQIDEAPHSRLSSVPKDFSKRRLICIEPVRRQFLQQGVARSLRSTRIFRHINLENQDAHAKFACNPSLMTIDLKDASDRIPPSLVEHLLPKDWVDVLMRTSSGTVRLPDGTTHRIGMFATMGCGFCFEVESLIFLIVTVGALLDWDFRSPSRIAWALSCIRVYGDDIICPRSFFPEVERTFQLNGWVINPKKTALTEEFRETVGYWISGDNREMRFLPQLSGDKSSLLFDSQEGLNLAIRASSAGYHALAFALVEDVRTSDDCRLRYDPDTQRVLICGRAKAHPTRPTNLSTETRWFCWWKTGCSAPTEEIDFNKEVVLPFSIPIDLSMPRWLRIKLLTSFTVVKKDFHSVEARKLVEFLFD